MESTTMLLLLSLTAPSLGYPYTRVLRGQLSDAGLEDYLGGYVGDDQYGVPDYQPSPRYTYAAQRPRTNKEAMAAILSAAIDDYMDYDTYNDDDGTWYDDFATADVGEPIPNEDSTLMQLLFNQRPASSTPVRYSLEDLENMERTAAREDNTENQLHALTHKAINKKSIMPMLGSRVAVTPMLLKKGQKEETFDIPATSVRRPVFARTISTYPDQPEPQQPIDYSQTSYSQTSENSSTQKPEEEEKESTGRNSNNNKNSEATISSKNSSSTSSSNNTESLTVPRARDTPYLKDSYETLRSFLDRERKARQERDEKQRAERKTPHKRFITEQESLTQQLANLKKTVA